MSEAAGRPADESGSRAAVVGELRFTLTGSVRDPWRWRAPRRRPALMRTVAFAMVLAALLGAALELPAVDLSGLWVKDNGSVVRLSQRGRAVRAAFVDVSAAGRRYGFAPGDVDIEGTLDERIFRGRIHGRYLPALRSTCPGTWKELNAIELRLAEDERALVGRWRRRARSLETCEVTREWWETVRYSRAPAGAPLGGAGFDRLRRPPDADETGR